MLGDGAPLVWIVRRLSRRQARVRWLDRLAAGCLVVALGGVVMVVTGHGSASWAALSWCAALGSVACVSFARLQPALAASVLGIALGVSAVGIVGGAADGVEEVLTTRLGALNGHLMVTKYGLDFTEYEDVAGVLADREDVVATSPFAYGTVTMTRKVSGEGVDTGAPVAPVVAVMKGVLPDRARGFPGFSAPFQGVDVSLALRPAGPRRPPGVALGRGLAARLHATPGDEIVLATPRALDGTEASRRHPPRYATFQVTSLLDSGLHEVDERVAMVHLTAAQALLFGERRVTGVEAFTTAPRRARVAVDEVVAALQPSSGPRLYRGGTWLDQSSELLSMITRGRLAVQGALSLLLVVAAGNLVGALIVFVRRRRAHIAMAMTMGATTGQVGAVFLAVAAGVGALGGAMGVALTGLGETLLRLAPLSVDGALYGLETLPVAISPSSLLLPWGLAWTLCVAVALPVARAAAKVTPATSLRAG